jgi:hypothetical protein
MKSMMNMGWYSGISFLITYIMHYDEKVVSVSLLFTLAMFYFVAAIIGVVGCFLKGDMLL